MPKRKRDHRPEVLFVTGAPGVGKTHLVQHEVLGMDEHGNINLEQWPLRRAGRNPQLTWHQSADGRVAVAGGYAYGDDACWGKRRNTVPPNGGTDTLQPQCTGLLADMLAGKMERLGGGPPPELVVVEASAKAKMAKKCVLDALLDARQTHAIELERPVAEAVAALARRDRGADGKGAVGTSAAELHLKYAVQVRTIEKELH